MRTRGRNGDGALRRLLPADVAEINRRFRLGDDLLRIDGLVRLDLARAVEQAHHFAERLHAQHDDAIDHRGFRRVVERHDHAAHVQSLGEQRQRDHALNGAHPAIERQLPRHEVIIHPRA